MSCLKPTEAWQDLHVFTKTGKHPVIFSYKELDPKYFDYVDDENGQTRFVSERYRALSVPCGKCVLCKQSRAWEITVRALLELQADPFQPSCFITLTCDDYYLDEVFPHGILFHRPWQLFAKKLRKYGEFRFLMCGEYGERTHRPHYHAVIFGQDYSRRRAPSDRSRDRSGLNMYKGELCDSPFLREVWKYGHIRCCPLEKNCIGYVAGYTMKAIQGEHPVSFWYWSKELESQGAITESYSRWSRKPGLGFKFLEKFPGLFEDSICALGDGTIVETLSPSMFDTRTYTRHYFDGRYFKKQLERAADKTDENFLQDNPGVRLLLAEKFDIMSARNRGRLSMERLHGPPSASVSHAETLKNRAMLLEYRLARKIRDIDA